MTLAIFLPWHLTASGDLYILPNSVEKSFQYFLKMIDNDNIMLELLPMNHSYVIFLKLGYVNTFFNSEYLLKILK